jgi:cytochrome c peroxidase
VEAPEPVEAEVSDAVVTAVDVTKAAMAAKTQDVAEAPAEESVPEAPLETLEADELMVPETAEVEAPEPVETEVSDAVVTAVEVPKAAMAPKTQDVAEAPAAESTQGLDLSHLGPLNSVPIPLPPDLDTYVADRRAAIELGKALFWDIQAGGDGETACASCHFHAGADNRTMNTLAPRTKQFRGANHRLTASDFPFHRLRDPSYPESRDNPVVYDTSEIVGSQGVIKRNFYEINDVARRDRGISAADDQFTMYGVNLRQVTGRNTPTVINAIFNDRNFWDGRASRYFNGVNPFGETDPEAKIWVADGNGNLTRVRILIDNASLASQAVGPPNTEIEMSWDGRTFPELGQKILARRPLDLQRIDPYDSVLGKLAGEPAGFHDQRLLYSDMVRNAFPERFWKSKNVTADGFTLMESNFSLFWGLSIMMYESTLISNDSPFDRYMKGDKYALSEKALRGLSLFVNEGKCVNCHSGPEFTGATISQLRGSLSGSDESIIEFMTLQGGSAGHYDSGFYNIGVRPTEEDLGVGASHPAFGPLSYTRRSQNGQLHGGHGNSASVSRRDRVAVDGAFKTPSLRNVELTGPYFHNGGQRTLREVVQFYVRGSDFLNKNIDNLSPDVHGISELQGDDEGIDALVEFLRCLTDERVRRQSAPVDHPSLPISNGARGEFEDEAIENELFLPAVGRGGGPPILTFEQALP